MAKTSKRQPMKRLSIDFGYRDENDREATYRLAERLSKPDNGSTYFAVNRAGWSRSLTSIRSLSDQRPGEPTHSSESSAHDAPNGRD